MKGAVRGGDDSRAVRGWWVLATLVPFGLYCLAFGLAMTIYTTV